MYYVCIVSNSSSGYNFVQSIAIILSPEVKCAKSERTIIKMRASVCFGFRLRLSLSLNGRMAIRRQNSRRITIRQIWKSQWNGQMVVQQLFCRRIAIRPFRLKLKLKRSPRCFENTKMLVFCFESIDVNDTLFSVSANFD